MNGEDPIAGLAEVVEGLKRMMAPDDTALVLLPNGTEFSVHKVSASAARVFLLAGGDAIKPGQGR